MSADSMNRISPDSVTRQTTRHEHRFVAAWADGSSLEVDAVDRKDALEEASLARAYALCTGNATRAPLVSCEQVTDTTGGTQ